MIKPTVGRVVLYRKSSIDPGLSNDEVQPMAATVAYVWNDNMVNLSVVDHNGVQFNKTSVILAQDRPASPGECEWMEYQKEQQAKADLESESGEVQDAGTDVAGQEEGSDEASDTADQEEATG